MAAILAFFFSPFGRYVAIGAAVVALAGGIWLHGDHNGASRIQGRWDAAVQATIERGEKARTDAESSIERDPAGGVSNDKYDRDTRPM
jgi:hypothetical protein